MNPSTATAVSKPAVKERPILFSGPMVRAILDGRKVQTRRIVKHCKQFTDFDSSPSAAYDALMADDRSGAFFLVAGDHGYTDFVPCPFGKPGDQFWVREAFRADPPMDGSWDYYSFSDGVLSNYSAIPMQFRNPSHVIYAADLAHRDLKYKPSIHMPRWASRITLEVTDVRVERLNDISDEDIEAEGTSEWVASGGIVYAPRPGFDGCAPDDFGNVKVKPNRVAFCSLWESINGTGSWSANPWVWVVSFRRLQK